MNKTELTKVEALKLVTSVVDNEASESERNAFFNFIETDESVHRLYESMQKVKCLIRYRCPSAKAPESLRRKVANVIKTLNDKDAGSTYYDAPSHGPSQYRKDQKKPHNFTSMMRQLQ